MTHSLPYPIWILVSRDEFPWRPVALTPGYATAFSNHSRAHEFIATSPNPEWELRLVARTTLSKLADSFLRQGVVGVALDTDPAGGGTRIEFTSATAN